MIKKRKHQIKTYLRLSFILYCAALICYFVSMFLVVGRFDEDDFINGFKALIIGIVIIFPPFWSIPFIYAWLANFFIIKEFLFLPRHFSLKKKFSIWGAWIMFWLSLTTFTAILSPIEISIYGFGAGVILWLAAVYLILIASGIKHCIYQAVKKHKKRVNIFSENAIITGSISLVILVSIVIYQQITVFYFGSFQEKTNMDGEQILVKFGTICRNPLSVIGPIQNFNGILRLSFKKDSSIIYPEYQNKCEIKKSITSRKNCRNEYPYPYYPNNISFQNPPSIKYLEVDQYLSLQGVKAVEYKNQFYTNLDNLPASDTKIAKPTVELAYNLVYHSKRKSRLLLNIIDLYAGKTIHSAYWELNLSKDKTKFYYDNCSSMTPLYILNSAFRKAYNPTSQHEK